MKSKILLLAGVATALVACSKSPPPIKTYTPDQAGIENCVSDGNSRSECTDAIRHAQQQAIQVSPRYTAMDQCIANYGADRCIPHYDNGNTWFGPMLTGFVLGQMVNGHTSYGYPVYINRSGGYYSNYDAVNRRVITNYSYRSAHPTYNYTPSRSLATRMPVTSSVSRGGFGSSSSAVHSPVSRGGFGLNSSSVSTRSSSFHSSSSFGSVSRGGFGSSSSFHSSSGCC